MDIDPNRVTIVAGRHFAQVEFDRVERFVNAAVISDVFQNTMNYSDDAALTADVAWRTRIAGRIFAGDEHGIANPILVNRFTHKVS